ncbi:MAG: hypothetical protein DRH56_09030 [Deltaproteobacteria bacterium]|nr:MAG: hypothetical protein DRH56_09030 [Deltaproteobacteria bacterium]
MRVLPAQLPTYLVKKEEAYSPRGRNAIIRFAIENKLKLSGETERAIFTCLGCGACTAVCLSSVQTKDLIFQNRECQVDEGFYPKIVDRLVNTLDDVKNISDDDNEDRAEWQELIKELPEDAFEKAHADILFFVGCVASFFPMVQKIPANMAKILQKAGVDFTILGGDEWCCGFPPGGCRDGGDRLPAVRQDHGDAGQEEQERSGGKGPDRTGR